MNANSQRLSPEWNEKSRTNLEEFSGRCELRVIISKNKQRIRLQFINNAQAIMEMAICLKRTLKLRIKRRDSDPITRGNFQMLLTT